MMNGKWSDEERLQQLNRLNDVKIYSVLEETFASYGRVVTQFDFTQMESYMTEHTPIPEQGNIYVPSRKELEEMPVAESIRNLFFGGMPIQVGFCNGKNTTYNGFEYHKSSELSVALTPLCIVLGHVWQIKDNHFYLGDERVFYVPAGTALEYYATTLHLSPCAVTDEGFRNIVVLPKGTNTPLDAPVKDKSSENLLLLQKNKWVIAHPEREPLIKQGAFAGFVGENKKINYK